MERALLTFQTAIHNRSAGEKWRWTPNFDAIAAHS